jgi:uncharacterized lipoprotein YehR (DUF1307 family)
MKKTVLLVALIAGFALTACGDKDEPMATFESPEAADKAVAAAAMKESPAMEDATKQ